MDKLRRLGCVCCHLLGFHNDQIEVHHIVDNGYRKHSGGHRATLPLCSWHHRSVVPNGFSRYQMSQTFGPSISGGTKTFAAKFGMQRELLAKVDELIGA